MAPNIGVVRDKRFSVLHKLIIPGVVNRDDQAFVIPLEDWKYIKNREFTLCIYIAIDYTDIYPPKAVHHTRECEFLTVIPDGSTRGFGSCKNNYGYAD